MISVDKTKIVKLLLASIDNWDLSFIHSSNIHSKWSQPPSRLRLTEFRGSGSRKLNYPRHSQLLLRGGVRRVRGEKPG